MRRGNNRHPRFDTDEVGHFIGQIPEDSPWFDHIKQHVARHITLFDKRFVRTPIQGVVIHWPPADIVGTRILELACQTMRDVAGGCCYISNIAIGCLVFIGCIKTFIHPVNHRIGQVAVFFKKHTTATNDTDPHG